MKDSEKEMTIKIIKNSMISGKYIVKILKHMLYQFSLISDPN